MIIVSDGSVESRKCTCTTTERQKKLIDFFRAMLTKLPRCQFLIKLFGLHYQEHLILFLIRISDTKHMMIFQCLSEKEEFKLMHVKINLRRIIVFS